MPCKRKSQIQIGETMAVLVIFFMLVTIGFMFYARVVKTNLQAEADDLSQLRSVSIAQNAMSLSELQCTQAAVPTANCIDSIKMEEFSKISSSSGIFYFDIFEFSHIAVQQVYPEEKSWVIYSRKREDFTNRFVTNIPVSIFNPLGKTFAFGIMTLETYSGGSG